jgi:hypothetical protein
MSWLDFVRNKYMSVGVHATNEIATTWPIELHESRI